MTWDAARARKTLLACASVLLAFDLLVTFAGDSPWGALARGLAGTWGSPYGIGQVLYKATPLLFSGVAFDVAFRAGLFNIGAEGQIAVGAFAAGVVAAKLPGSTPTVVAVPIALFVAALVAGAWSAIAGAMRAWLSAHEVISTIMLNRIADALVPFLLVHGLGAGGVRTLDAIAGARLSSLSRFFPALHGSAASLAFPFAVATAFAVYAWSRKSRVGREIAWVGLNQDASRAEGIPAARRIFLAMCVSGAVAGLAASATVLGYKGYFELGSTSGAGFGGIAVALLAGGSPLGMLGASLLVGTLAQAGLALNATVPREVMDVLFGVTILVVAHARGRAAEAA